MMENLWIYEKSRACPQEALKPIQGGKLKGKSDINPMWRIKLLTELFGPCGVGWKTEDEQYWTTPGASGEVIAWCSIKLRWWDKEAATWSSPVNGIGGSMMVETEKGKLVSNDEAYKMAYTDAISVACKALGFAADVYWGNDRTKYDRPDPDSPPPPPPEPVFICEDCTLPIKPFKKRDGTILTAAEFAENTKKLYGRQLCFECQKKAAAGG